MRSKTKKQQPFFGTWNVRTLMDTERSERSERRNALVARELRQYNIDIATLQETRRDGEGQLTEKGAENTFFSKEGRKTLTTPMTVLEL